LLIEASFADVAIVRGGMEQWQREGFAVAGATIG
jgi:rhodanese-related sulfurtransferase